MAAILYKAWEGYHFVFDEITDPSTKTWLFAAKPYQGLLLLGLYLMFVLKWGPKWMQNRPPFNLDKALIFYNAFQVIACSYVFFLSIYHAWGWEYKWICEPIDHSQSPKSFVVRRVIYYYFILKLLDLLDTVFFVLRKKFNQITFLHIYHHTGMVMLIWGAVTYVPGGHGTLVGVINCFVHTVMYSYYLLTVIEPSYKLSFWWKKHITQLQILQFFLCIVHMAVIVFKPDCAYPRWISAIFLPQNLFMLVLFIDFYIKTYIRKPSPKGNSTNGLKRSDESNEYINGKTNGFNASNGLTNGKNYVNSTQEYPNGKTTEFDDNNEYAGGNISDSIFNIAEEADRKGKGYRDIIDRSRKYEKRD